MRVALVALSLLIAVAVPNLELAIALIGAVLFSTVGLLIPAGVHLVSELGLIAVSVTIIWLPGTLCIYNHVTP